MLIELLASFFVFALFICVYFYGYISGRLNGYEKALEMFKEEIEDDNRQN